jgi:hypothetical protein
MSCSILASNKRRSSARMPVSRTSAFGTRRFVASVVAMFLLALSAFPVVAQTPVLTQHYDNFRTGQNITETILAPGNVNPTSFGKLFTQTLDGQMPAQPLYVPSVFIPSANSTHNVVYVATMHDSVYAFDADNNQGGNASPLWYVNLTDPANGITSVPEADEFCKSAYTEFGIQGTPVIDTTRNAIYVLAMTKENGVYVHRLHALDLGTGAELFGGPTEVTGTVTIDGTVYNFIPKYQQDRPALLEQDGIIYIGFGGPGCNVKTENGWIMAYDGGTLQQVGVFDASPNVLASAVWLSGAGPVGDGNSNVYFNTGDGLFDADTGGSHYGDSVLKFAQGDGVISLLDSFTPFNQKYLQVHDLDVSSGALLLTPPASGSNLLIGVDKNATIYVMDPNNLGGYNTGGDVIYQELNAVVNGQVHAGLAYWNNNVYLQAYETPVMAYSLTGGFLSPTPTSQTPRVTAHPQGGIVSSNGANDGIFWYVSVPTSILFAFDATNLANEFYDSTMSPTRDKLGPSVHYEMPIVADGHVYVNGMTELAVFGLLPGLTPTAGNNQTGLVKTALPIALTVQLQDPYNGPIQTAGVPVTFKSTAGTLSNPTATTNASGQASTTYTLGPKTGVFTVTASSSGYASATFTETAALGQPASVSISSGNSQKAPVNTKLPLPLTVKVKDLEGNGIPGIQVTFSDGGAGGTLGSPVAVSDSTGIASTTYTTGTTAGAINITASVTGLTPAVFKETVLAGPGKTIAVLSGDVQTVKAGTKTPKELEVIATDKFGNLVSGLSVTFNDGSAGGTFSPNPVATTPKGVAGTRYTTPTKTGTVTVTASATGVSPVRFMITVD